MINYILDKSRVLNHFKGTVAYEIFLKCSEVDSSNYKKMYLLVDFKNSTNIFWQFFIFQNKRMFFADLWTVSAVNTSCTLNVIFQTNVSLG